MQKKICAVYGEGAVTGQHVKSGLGDFVLEIFRWMMRRGRVDKLKVKTIQIQTTENSQCYTM